MRFIQFRSAPAQNAEPAPVSTTACTASSLSRSSNARVKSAINASSKALRTSGRLSVTMATMLRFSTIRFSGMDLSGYAGFDDDCALHGIGDEAALVRFFVQLRELLRRRPRAGEFHHGPQRDARHRLPAFGIPFQQPGSFVDVAHDGEIRVAR